MQELERLIRKFWSNETSQDENRRLLQLLGECRDHYREELKAGFGPEQLEGAERDAAASLLAKIHRDLGMEGPEEERRVRVHFIRRRYRHLAVAAVICAISVAVFLLLPRHRQQRPVAVETVAVTKPGPFLVELACVRNPDTSLVLDDGSTVQLRKNSRLSFYRPFRGGRRDIWLEGAATFDVAKDRSKPFTVYAGEVETRVLGTRFSVNASEAGKVKVRLLEGKIAVSSRPTAGSGMKALYLLPGQELSFDKSSRLYTVNTIKPRSEKPASTEGTDLVFHKEPLSRVFQKIGNVYKVNLAYRKEELNGLYFTGTFLRSDDIHIVLSAICNVHSLELRGENDSLIITRSH